MKTSDQSLIAQHNALQSQPYGKRRNAKLERVQRALELRGLFNFGGQLRSCITAHTVGDFQVLSIGGAK